jgi:hypothetical protein
MNALNVLQVHYMDISLYEIHVDSKAEEFCLLFCHGLHSNVITFNKNCCQASSDLTSIAFLIIACFLFSVRQMKHVMHHGRMCGYVFTRPLYIALINHVPYLVHICQMFWGEATHAQPIFQDCAMQHFALRYEILLKTIS